MPVQITITSHNGTFNFSDYDNPIVHRRMTNRAGGASEALAAATSISMSLNGWFEGSDHSEVVAKYQLLLNVLKAPEIKVTYFDGAQFVLNDQICFVENYEEPRSWKEYSGDYNISFRYIEELSHQSYMNIPASYSSPAGSYIFETTPIWTLKPDRVNSGIGHGETTPAGSLLGSRMIVTLTGELAGSSHQDISSKMSAMSIAFTRNGILNYGVWTDNVDVISPPSFGPTLPYFTSQYQIVLGYLSEGLSEFQSMRSATRVNYMPDIRKRKFCPTDYVRQNRLSGQEVTYTLSAKGTSISQVKALLRAEAWNIIIPGGTEMEGGTQNEDDMANKVSAVIKKFYLTPVIPNIEV